MSASNVFMLYRLSMPFQPVNMLQNHGGIAYFDLLKRIHLCEAHYLVIKDEKFRPLRSHFQH